MNKTSAIFILLLLLPLSAVAEPLPPLTLSEVDGFRQQLAKCWNVPAEAKNIPNSNVTLRIELAQDGTVLLVKILPDTSRYNSDPIYRKVADAAIHAVKVCSPFKNLPLEKYETWRDIEMEFDPSTFKQ